MGAGGARSREKDWKVLRGLRLRCNGFGFGELRDNAELLHKAESVPADIGFRYLAVGEAANGYSGNGELLPGWRNPVRSPLWVPRQDQRVMTVSPSAMMSSIVKRRSGKAVR